MTAHPSNIPTERKSRKPAAARKPSKAAAPVVTVEWHAAQIAEHIRAIAALMPAHGPSAAYDALESLMGLVEYKLAAVTNARN